MNPNPLIMNVCRNFRLAIKLRLILQHQANRAMKTDPTTTHHQNILRIDTNTPPTKADHKRPVQIGYRPVGGRAAAWTVGVLHEVLKRVGNMGIRLQDKGPSPHYHWCVIVGESYHQAQSAGGEGGMMYYTNDTISWSEYRGPKWRTGLTERQIEDGWLLFDVGETTFNDAAIVEAGMRFLFSIS